MQTVSRSQAIAAGAGRYFTGQACKHGHIAERYVKGRGCVECLSAGAAQPTRDVILKDEVIQNARRQAAIEMETGQLASSIKSAVAKATKLVFDKLETPEMIAAIEEPVPFTPNFHWNEQLMQTLVERYIDTGDIADARAQIGVSPSAFHKKLEASKKFRDMLEEARPLAEQHLEERAIQLALKGNDKLLQTVLKAKNPAYRDNIKIDLNAKVSNISDEELDRRLKLALDSGVVLAVPQAKAGGARLIGRSATPESAEQNSNAISDRG